MSDHPLGGEEYVTRSGKLESTSSITWRVIIPDDISIDWRRLRAAVGTHKGRIEYCLIQDPNDINAGITMNEKIAGLTFPNTTGKLDFNSGFRSDNPVFRQ
jgi:hypothetical protein